MDDAASPRRVLVLGGTRWLGRAVAEAHLARGAEVTCLARGESGAVAAGARRVQGDRDREGAYAALEGAWDEVVEVTSLPAHEAGAFDALADRAAHWTFVSSISAQRLEGAPAAADEEDELVPEDPTGEEYGGAKAWIERTARERLGERLAIVRPGLMGGPGDESDRVGHWVARPADADDRPARSRRLPRRAGAAPRRHGERGRAGRLAACAHRALPLVLPAALASHCQCSSVRHRAAGGMHRALRATLEAVLDDERACGLDRASANRPARADELAVIDSLAFRT